MMEKLIKYLNNNNIPYSTQYNADNDLVIDFLVYEIVEDGDKFCVAATNTMNFRWMSLPEIREWLMDFYL